MSIDQAISALATRVRELKPIIETEEATKTAFIIPFISNVLGYDVTDPPRGHPRVHRRRRNQEG